MKDVEKNANSTGAGDAPSEVISDPGSFISDLAAERKYGKWLCGIRPELNT